MGKSTISMAIFNSYVSHYQRVQQQKQQIFSATAAVEEPRRACCAVPSGSSLLILGGVQNEVRGSPGGRMSECCDWACLFSPWVQETLAFNIEIYRKGDLEYPYLKNPPIQKKEQITRGLEESKWEYDTV